jgi:hypothetical protein
MLNLRYKISRFLGFLALVVLILSSCSIDFSSDKKLEFKRAYCSAEKLDSTGKRMFGEGKLGKLLFKVGGKRSSLHAKSGQFSVQLDKKHPFGMTYRLDHLKDGQRYRVSVWRYDPSKKAALIIAGDKTQVLYEAQKHSAQPSLDGWELLEKEFVVKPNLDYIKIYVWLIDAQKAWFDDLKIEEIPQLIYPSYAQEQKLHLYFMPSQWDKLEAARVRAFKNGILVQGPDDWAKGILSDEKDVLPIKARLKGDWLDHLEGRKWSYRVKLRKSKSFAGMTVFSLQNPATRSNLMEFVAHKLFSSNDVLTTRYDFVPLYVNQESRGIYALEEHFAKQLVEYNQRREGPLLHFNEEAFWAVQKYFKLDKKWYLLPYFQTALPEAFQESKLLKSSLLKSEFDIAQALLWQYKNHSKAINQIFDVEKLATYWALVDLTKTRHGMAWHNQRFYYNPINCLLEPVAFDGYTANMENFKEDKAIYGNYWFPEEAEIPAADNLLLKIFQDTSFQKLYVEKLRAFSDENYLRHFFAHNDSIIRLKEALLAQEFRNYHYDSGFIFNNARNIRKELPSYIKRWNSKQILSYPLKEAELDYDTVYRTDIVPLFVNAFYHPTEKKRVYNLEVENNYTRAIELIGLVHDDLQVSYSFKGSVIVSAYQKHGDKINIQLEPDSLNRFLAFRVEGKSELLYAPLHFWQKKEGESPRQELLRQNNFMKSDVFMEKNDTIWVKTGSYTLRDKVVIPANKLLYFQKGVKLDLIQSAAIISLSPIRMQGTETEPIQVYSSDSSGMGISVLQSKAQSFMQDVRFAQLRSFSYKGWTLTGSVNFYEADVKMNRVMFTQNHSEDALNVVRSQINLNNLHFESIASDALDGDFVTGHVANSTFQSVKNDALDFSGSNLRIQHIKMNKIGDKGLSGGEKSTIEIDDVSIRDANIGIASKDLSRVEANEVSLQNCAIGFLALQKKPEYGPAQLKVHHFRFTDGGSKFLIEENSLLILNDRVIHGDQKKLAARFYGD